MKISRLALAGFLAYASFTAVAFLYLFLSGRADAVGVHLRPVVVVSVFFSLFIGALGVVIGMGFSLFHRLTPRSNLYLSGSAYNLLVNALLLPFGRPHPISGFVIVSVLASAVFVGLLFAGLY